MPEQPWGPGYVVDGKYQLTSKLGEGGMGSVWRADHLTLNAPVAVKLLGSIANSEEGQTRFLREAQAAAALRSAHVVQTFDYGIDKGIPFIVMELLVGDTLSERVAAKGPLAPSVVARLLRQVARAVGKAHQAGIVHRDLKPDNIFLVEGEDDDFTAKVLDFGIAKATAGVGGPITGSKTRTGALLGTPYYMSPEQAQGTKVIDFRTDLWALGVITYECLLGKRPFDSEALGDLLLKICASPPPVPSQEGTVPAGFDAWFDKATKRDPAERFQTASEMAKAFTEILEPRSGTISSDSSLSGFGPVPALGPAGDSLEGSEVTPARAANQTRTRMMIGAAAGVVALIGLALMLGRGGSKAEGPPHDSPKSVAQAPAIVTPPAPAPEPSPAPEATPPPTEEGTAQPSASASRKSSKPSKSAGAAAKAPPAAATPAAAPKKQETFDPLMMRR